MSGGPKGTACTKLSSLLALINRMIAGIPDWMQRAAAPHAASEAFGGLGKVGLITLIVVSIIAIVTFVWIFHETGKRD